MSIIPIVPGLQVATGGILDRPLKDLICALLFGGLGNLLNGNLLCLQANINTLLADAGMANLDDLRNALTDLRDELLAFEQHLGIPEMLARINGAIGDIQRILALGGMCKIPLIAPRIPDVLAEITNSYFASGLSILNDLGRLMQPQLCLDGAGGINTGSYKPDTIMGSLMRKIGRLDEIPQTEFNRFVNRINGVKNAIKSQINQELFPDFRHKHNLLTGRPKVSGQPALTIADVNKAHSQALQINSGLKQTASYPVKAKGITYSNPWAPVLGPSVYSLAVDTLTPADPTLIRQIPVYDYCGRLMGYEEDLVAGEREATGEDSVADAEPNPLKLNHTMLWINGTEEDPERIGWAEEGNTSPQPVGPIGSRRISEALNLNPEITIYRGRSHLFVLPPSAIQEFYIYETKTVGGNLVPDTTKRFSKGLSRFESGELLDEANGRNEDATAWIDLTLPEDERNSGPEPAAWRRKDLYPTGMTLMINVAGSVHPDPDTPLKDIISETSVHIEEKWPNYLAYSNEDGTRFGLLKIV